MKLENVILRGTAASRPASATVPIGTLYYSTDTLVTERNNGTTWDSYSDAGSAPGLNQLTGDVTAGPGTGSQVATIPAGTVTYAKMQDVSAAERVLGRGAGGGSGDAQELTIGPGLYFNGTELAASVVVSQVFGYTFSTSTTAPPANQTIRLDAASPYTTVTKLWADFDSNTGQDLYWGWMLIKTGSTLLLQDKDDHTRYVMLLVTGAPVDHTTYVELPVSWVANGSALLAQDILVRVRATGIPDAHASSHETGGSDPIAHLAGSVIDSGTVANARLDSTVKSRTIGITVDGGGSVLTTGAKGFRSFMVAGTITRWRIIANAAGNIQFDIKKSTYAAFPTQSSIVASAPPTMTGVQNNEDTTLSGWTTAVNAGDVFGFEITGTPATITRATLELTIVVT